MRCSDSLWCFTILKSNITVSYTHLLNNFIENLELAQSYGQIEETKENKKEKIQKIANEWFAYADETKNYGFFKRILEEYEKKRCV